MTSQYRSFNILNALLICIKLISAKAINKRYKMFLKLPESIFFDNDLTRLFIMLNNSSTMKTILIECYLIINNQCRLVRVKKNKG